MSKKQSVKMVHCRYPKCFKLHPTTELKKEDAIQGSTKSWYHPDCYHTMQTINKIGDMFYKNVDNTITGKQYGSLISTINNMVFEKKIDVDFIKFALQYYLDYKPGALKHIYGIHYIIQNDDVKKAWKSEQERLIKTEMRQKINDDRSEAQISSGNSFAYKPKKPSGFETILQQK